MSEAQEVAPANQILKFSVPRELGTFTGLRLT